MSSIGKKEKGLSLAIEARRRPKNYARWTGREVVANFVALIAWLIVSNNGSVINNYSSGSRGSVFLPAWHDGLSCIRMAKAKKLDVQRVMIRTIPFPNWLSDEQSLSSFIKTCYHLKFWQIFQVFTTATFWWWASCTALLIDIDVLLK